MGAVGEARTHMSGERLQPGEHKPASRALSGMIHPCPHMQALTVTAA